MSGRDYQELMKRTLVELRDMKGKLGELEEAKREPIAVVGIGCRFPSADDPQSFWKVLAQGVDAITEVPWSRWKAGRLYDEQVDAPGRIYVREGAFLDGVEHFDAAFFGVTPREAQRMSPQQRVLLEVAWEALENANLVPDRLFNSAGGVFVGACGFDYGPWGVGHLDEVDAYSLTGGSLSVVSGRLSYALGLTGPSMVVDTACSSSLVAIHQACRSLRAEECNLALAAGVHVMSSPAVAVGLCRIRALSPDGRCKTFDASADGYTRGEGCGVLVLKRLSDAVEAGDRVLALVRGSAVNQDGASGGLTVPSGPSQEAVIRQALAEAAIEPAEVAYVEAHGTGTSLGDPIEIGALEAVYGDRDDDSLKIGSVKTNIGHLEGAAGVAGVIKTVLCFNHDEIPAHLHLTEPNPHIPWSELPFEIPTAAVPWPRGARRRCAAVSSFGLSGTNAHVVLEEAPVETIHLGQAGPDGPSRPMDLLTLSAKTESALRRAAKRHAHHLREHPDVRLADFCHTANTRRSRFEHRLTVASTNAADLADQLAAAGDGQPVPGTSTGVCGEDRQPLVAYLFTGQGSQRVGMGRELYDTEPVFRGSFDRCAEILDPMLDRSIREVVYTEANDGESALLHQTGYTQPALFALEYALAAMWRAWGIEPSWVMGHSIGEYVAACVAEVFSLEDGLKLVAARGRLMQELPAGGAMAAVFADDATVTELLDRVGPGATIAAYNGPRHIVISGEAEAVTEACSKLAETGVKSQRLRVSHAFHSALMDPMVEAFEAIAAEVTYAAPRIALVSNLTGEPAGVEIATARYWVDHVRAAVRFAQGSEALFEAVEAASGDDERPTLVEVGPQPTLLGMVAAMASERASEMASERAIERSPRLVPSLRPGTSDWAQILSSLGDLYVAGVDIDWEAFDAPYSTHRVEVPVYPFDRQRFPLEAGFSSREGTATPSVEHGSVLDLLEREETEELALRIAGASALSPEEAELLPKLLSSLSAEHHRDCDRASLQDWLYELAWRSRPRRIDDMSDPSAEGLWVLLGGPDGLRRELEERLTAKGWETATVTTGHELVLGGARWTIDPDRPDHYAELVAGLTASGAPVARIVHLESLVDGPDRAGRKVSTATLAGEQRRGGHTLLHLAKALAGGNVGGPTRLWVVTRGAVAATETAEDLALGQSPLWGMGRALALEIPELWGGLVDLDPEGAPDDAERLIEELSASGAEDQIAYRRGMRYVPRLTRIVSDTAPPVAVDGEGAYLVTGGLGGFGLSISHWLVDRGARHLVLIGRRGAATEEARAAVRALEEAGARIDVARADVADADAMRKVFSTLDGDAARLRGVVHCAGVGSYEELEQIDAERFDSVLRPKTLGTWVLHEATLDRDLDFFVCCSSIASLWGSRAQVHYAAANHFQDTIAHHRRALGLPALTVNWGPLAGSGMLTDEFLELMAKVGVTTIPIERAVTCLERLLDADRAQLAVADVNWGTFRGVLEARRQRRLFDEIETEPELPTETDAGPSLVETLTEMEPRERLDRLVLEIQTEVAHVMGIGLDELPPPDRGFFDIGMDSIMAVDLKNRFSARIGSELPSTLAFDYPTIQTLAGYLIRDVLQLQTDHTEDGRDTSTTPRDETFSETDLEELSGAEVSALLDAELEEVDGLIGSDVNERL